MRNVFVFWLLLFGLQAFGQTTPYENSGKKETTTYKAAISYYKSLVKNYSQARLETYGKTDFGYPLHLLILSKDKVFDPVLIRKANKRVLLINNGIHPGEPEGIDASMMLARDLLKNNQLPKDVVICIIPVYNIDGSFNRTGTSRANQNGPTAYGFRGNSKNLDLNRDFIKTDSKNSAAFQLIFNTWKPEIFVDTHTSNGSDYQYVMTLIPTQKDKLNSILSGYLTKTLVPDLYKGMEKLGYPMVPYVNSIGETPERGITGFIESPRYSTGYANLHNSIGFMPETHMLKSFDLRVDATYKLLKNYVDIVQRDAKVIGENKRKADDFAANQKTFPLEWKVNHDKFDSISFEGYEAGKKPSAVSGIERLYYDRAKPYTKTIKQWNNYEPSIRVEKPIAYIIPKAWDKVIALLKLNNVTLKELKNDVKLNVESYYIADLKTGTRPYEGHYVHNAVKLNAVNQQLQYYAGDFVVYVNQPENRYIVETLEPQATDSFFNWNFFDSILDMKEHYSAYIFEDTATEILKNDTALKTKLIEKKLNDTTFAKSGSAQLDFIYKNSDYYEKTHNRYPIARLIKDVKLDLK
ncbi:M14 family zinc carboxypeptidase [Pedobacter aquatilis]|uniref:M14 family zinc carboxypeptidase n=1 Tax=Pedobacter aquatilis TaxID=351343 RepID=UPI0025B40A9C|nr:M14 family zinc carboxypeptidase [Pedobacter aquatilis]MDN3587817.1 M14 family zinc carboxypeptidase [Pedobacter aquatilis]